MSSSDLELYLTVTEGDADAEMLDRLTGRLMGDLRKLGVDSAERPSGGPAPEDAKGDPFTLGALALVAVPALAPKLVEFLQGFAQRGVDRVVKIRTPAGLEVEFTAKKKLSESELLTLVEKLASIQA